MKHFQYGELDMYQDGELPLWKHVLCKIHLLNCPECREQLRQLKKDSQMIDRLRSIRYRVPSGKTAGDSRA
jgi:predicted anti-sigma-YlaC factor YlaD